MQIQKVCLVDDSNAIHKVSNRIFVQQLGKELISAMNGFEAIDAINTERPDACFIDIEMPELNGLELVSIIRANPKFEKMPIAVLSSASSIFDRQKGFLFGADIYLTKPFSAESIQNALRDMEALHD